MPFKRHNPGCPCCDEISSVDCGCFQDFPRNPVLLIDLNIAVDVFGYSTCYTLVDGIFFADCRIQQGNFGVGLQGTISVPLKLECKGDESTLRLDIDETYRMLEGDSILKQRLTGPIECQPLNDIGTREFWIEFNKETNQVSAAAHNTTKTIWPINLCSRTGFIDWIEPFTGPAPGGVDGACMEDVLFSSIGGSVSWSVV